MGVTGRDGCASLEEAENNKLSLRRSAYDVTHAFRSVFRCLPWVALLWASSTSTHIILAVGSDRGLTLVRRAKQAIAGRSRLVNLEELWSCPFQISESKFRMQKLDRKEVKVHILVF